MTEQQLARRVAHKLGYPSGVDENLIDADLAWKNILEQLEFHGLTIAPKYKDADWEYL